MISVIFQIVSNIFLYSPSPSNVSHFFFENHPHPQLAEKYGDVYSIRMGQMWMVVLNRLEVLKEGLVTQGDSLVDRPKLPLQDDMSNGLGEMT